MIRNPLFNLTGDQNASVESISRMSGHIHHFADSIKNLEVSKEIIDAIVLEYAKTILHVHEWNATTEDTTPEFNAPESTK